MDALSASTDLALFRTKVVQTLIDFKKQDVRRQMLIRQLAPYAVYVASRFWWSHSVYDHAESSTRHEPLNYALSFVQLTLSVYFLSGEIVQICAGGWEIRDGYFAQAWNYLDLGPPAVILYVVVAYLLTEVRAPAEPRLMAFAAAFQWLRLLNFLRTHPQSGYFTRMLLQTALDMRAFGIVSCVTVLAFADTTYTIFRANLPSEHHEG